MRGLLHPFFCIFKKPGFSKDRPFHQKPGFSKDRPFHQKPGFSKTPSFSSKARVFEGSEVLTGQHKNPGFVFKSIFSNLCYTYLVQDAFGRLQRTFSGVVEGFEEN